MSSLEQRIQRLEDIEDIRRLKFAYAKAVDRVETGGTESDVNAVVALFAEDAVFDIGAFGLHKGRAAIREVCSGIRSAITLGLHFIVTSSIDIAPSGNEATGTWYMLTTQTFQGQAVLGGFTWEDRYRKVNGKWLFAHKKLIQHYFTPLDQGWVKVNSLV